MHRLILLFLLCLLSSCGYRIGSTAEIARFSTIAVPYIEGDNEGVFTSSLIKELVSSGPLHYVSSGDADLLLKVSVASTRMEGISFQFPKQVSGNDKRLVPSENRLRMLIKAQLIDNSNDADIIEPIYLVEGVDFDFLPIGSAAENALEFSLGQLDSEEGARSFANTDIYQKLAKSVVDYLYSIQ